MCFPSRHSDPDFEAAPSTFASDEPLRRPLIRGTLVDPVGMHPTATATGQHGFHLLTECSKATSGKAATSESARRTPESYAERLSEARTKLEALFNILLPDLSWIEDVEHGVRRRTRHEQDAIDDHREAT